MAPKIFLQSSANEVEFDNVMSLCEKSSQEYRKEKSKQMVNSPTSEATAASILPWPGQSKLGELLLKISNNLAMYQKQIDEMKVFCPKYDSKCGVAANGYRSFLDIARSFIQCLTPPLVALNAKGLKKGSRRDWDDLNHYSKCLETLVQINGYLLEMHEISEEGCLFPDKPDIFSHSVEELSRKIAETDSACFYGKSSGFHYKGDSRRIVQPLILAMASLGDIFDGSLVSRVKKVINGIFGLRYTLDWEFMAAKVFEDAKEKPVEFCKTFYNMPELELTPLRRHKSPGIKANYLIQIPPKPMSIMNTQGAAFQVPVPSSHIGPDQPIQVRLVSPFRSNDMVGKCLKCVPSSWPGSNCNCQITPESDTIFFHLHGGGFVSQTSKSHESYLKIWARSLGIPILSVDYSLAPEAPYPRAVEEVLYAYCWMRNNFKLLGTNGLKVIVGGDSAGGNLSIGLILQCIQLSLPKPDHLLAFYPSLLCQMYPSPSRLVCLLDPLVMFPCLLRCLNSYADKDYRSSCPRTFIQELEACQSYTDPLLSPLLTPVELLKFFPPCTLFTSNIDPCLDETVTFSNKLVAAGVKVKLDVLSGLPHGFLSLTGLSKDCALAVEHITEKLRDLILT